MNNRMSLLPQWKRPRPHGASARIGLAVATGLLVAGAAACDPTVEEVGAPSVLPAPPGPGIEIPLPGPVATPQVPTVIGPELQLDAPVLGQATGRQSRPQAAFNGESYLVIWEDNRPQSFGARVAQDGTVLDPAAIPLPLDYSFAVASDGDGFLVVGDRMESASGGPGLVAARVSAAGALLGTSVLTPSRSWAPKVAQVASSGAGYLVVWLEGEDWLSDMSLRRARIALDGTVLDPGGIVMDTGDQLSFNVAFNGTSYVVAWYSQGVPARVATVSPGGDILHEAALPGSPSAMACDAGRCLVAWREDALMTSWMTPEGALLDPQGALVTGGGSDGHVAVGFDGPDGLVAWSDGSYDCSTDRVRYTRVTPQGAVVTPGGGILLQEGASDPALAWDGERAFFLWSDDHDEDCGSNASIYGAHLSQQGTVLEGGGVLVSRGANAQFNPSLAFDGTSVLVTWSDNRNFMDLGSWDVYAARLSPGGDLLDPAATLLGAGPLSQFHPRAAFDGSSSLVAWWACSYINGEADDCGIAGARLGAAGAEPLSFPFEFYWEPDMPPALSCGGGGALVSAFVDDAKLVTAAIEPGGVATPDVPNEGEASTQIAGAFDGVNHLMVWTPYKQQGGGPLLGARVAPDGTVLDPGGFAISPPGTDALAFSLAFGGGEYLVAWHDAAADSARVLAARVSPGGAVLDPEPIVVMDDPACGAPWDGVLGASAVAFDGERFVLGWRAWCDTEGIELFGALVDLSGAVRARFPITSDGRPEGTPALVGLGAGGTLIAYSSFRAEAPLGAWRVITRRLDAPPSLDGDTSSSP